ncbi:hypothetical protein MRX96_035630 [Rhipicephalus microplus]
MIERDVTTTPSPRDGHVHGGTTECCLCGFRWLNTLRLRRLEAPSDHFSITLPRFREPEATALPRWIE